MEKLSPFASLFTSNSAPTDKEMEDLKVLIKGEQAYLDNLNKEIQDLVERRDAHTRVLEKYCALLSPLRRIPSDVLLSIFEYACLKGFLKARAQSTFTVKSTKGLPSVVLSHVCQEWRRLSLNHPILWSEIHFLSPSAPTLPPEKSNPAVLEDFSTKLAWYKRNVKNMTTRYQVYISRSDPFPLNISLNASDSSAEHEGTPSITKIMADMLCSVSTRWKRIDMFLTISKSDSPLLPLLDLSKHDLPLLEELELDVSVCRPWPFAPDSEPLPAVTKVDFLQAPRLRSLCLNRLPRKIQYNSDVNWRTVTDLHIGDFALSYQGVISDPQNVVLHALEILASFPNLVYCSLSLRYSPDQNPANFPYQSPPISLPYLTSLSMRGSPLPRGLASSLNLPSLVTLALLPAGEPEDETTSEVVDWIRKFGHQLTELTFNYRTLTQSALLYCLKNLPNLTLLRAFGTDSHYRVDRYGLTGYIDSDGTDEGGLESAMITDSVLERLTPRFRSTDGKTETVDLPLPLCPKLKKVSIWPTWIEFTEKAFLKFVAARRHRHLRTSHSSSSSFPSEAVVSLLETVIVCFSSARERDLREVLEEDGSLDLDEFVLVVRARQFGPYGRPYRSLIPVTQSDQFEELVKEENELIRN